MLRILCPKMDHLGIGAAYHRPADMPTCTAKHTNQIANQQIMANPQRNTPVSFETENGV